MIDDHYVNGDELFHWRSPPWALKLDDNGLMCKINAYVEDKPKMGIKCEGVLQTVKTPAKNKQIMSKDAILITIIRLAYCHP